MVRMTQGLNADDTIYTVKYDNKGRIAFIPDSLHGYIDTIHVAYDDKDRIVGVTAGPSDFLSFKTVYNQDGLLYKTNIIFGMMFFQQLIY